LEKLLAIDRFLVFQFDDCWQTGLIWAAKRNNSEMVKFLCEHHSRVNFQDIAGRTALLFAAKNGNLEMTKLLLLK
jgi:ankyrin repeat protein